MKKCFLDIYLDNNIGDDLMITGLLEQFPKVEFYAVSGNEIILNTFSEYMNIKFVSNYNDLFEEGKPIFDTYMTVGGSMFQYRSMLNNVSKYLKIRRIKKSKRHGVKIYTIGSNLGPFNARFSEKLAKKELNLNDYVSVRDKASLAFLRNNLKNVEVNQFDDIVLELDYLQKYKHEENNTEVLGISAYRSTQLPSDNLSVYKAMADIINKTGDRYKEVRLFAFNTENENDLSAAHHIINLVDPGYKGKCKIVAYLGNEKEFLEEFANCNLHVAIRFHSAILSHLFGVPFVPIAYSNKMSDYLRDLDSEYTVVTYSDLAKSVRNNDYSFTDKVLENYVIDVPYTTKRGHLCNLKRFIMN